MNRLNRLVIHYNLFLVTYTCVYGSAHWDGEHIQSKDEACNYSEMSVHNWRRGIHDTSGKIMY